VDFYSSRRRGIDHYIIDGEFSKYQGCDDEPREEFENGIV
jgi:hypothetical protein